MEDIDNERITWKAVVGVVAAITCPMTARASARLGPDSSVSGRDPPPRQAMAAALPPAALPWEVSRATPLCRNAVLVPPRQSC